MKENKQHFVQLAQVLDPDKHMLAGAYLSEKMDGSRAIWDGGASRGMWCDEIPWANVAKDARFVNRQKATGLWSRYGNQILAPEWFLDALPVGVLCDGELYAGRGRFQFTRSTTSTKNECIDEKWQQIQFVTLDLPAPQILFRDRKINETNFKKDLKGCVEWYERNAQASVVPAHALFSFHGVQTFLKTGRLPENEFFKIAPQEQLPFNTTMARQIVEERMLEVVEGGGEGVIIRRPQSMWKTERVWDCLKYKPFNDAEGTVVGYTWGRETALGSKLLGMMGNLILDYKGKRLELSGFTNAERAMVCLPGGDPLEGLLKPGTTVSSGHTSRVFPIGSQVTFIYRELSDSGVPKEARHHRTFQP